MNVKSFIVAMALVSATSHAGLYWGSGINVIQDFNGDPVPTSDSFDPTVGAFAQLIQILNGTTPYAFVNSGSGISVGNEIVVQTVYSGLYDDLSDPGTFAFSGTTILNGSEFNGTYYVRVFDAPQSSVGDWNLGVNAPIPASAQYFYQSSTHSYTHNELSPETWNFGAGQTTLAVVPEPGTFALLGIGMIGLAVRRRMVG